MVAEQGLGYLPFPPSSSLDFSSLQDLNQTFPFSPFSSLSVVDLVFSKALHMVPMQKGTLRLWVTILPGCLLFLGLSLPEAKKLSSYFHFREAVELKNKTLLEKADLDPSLDFMDSLEYDIPKGSSPLS